MSGRRDLEARPALGRRGDRLRPDGRRAPRPVRARIRSRRVGFAASSVDIGFSAQSDHDEKVADLDRISDSDPDPLHGTLAGCPELILHLHGLDDEDLLARLDTIAGADGDRDDASRDDRADLDRAAW